MSISDSRQPTLFRNSELWLRSGGDRSEKTSPPPFSLRLTFEERAILETAAAGMPVGAYIRERLFGSEVSHRKPRGKAPVKDHRALAQVLGALGASRLSSNLNQLAKAAHMGALPVTPETEAELKSACEAVGEMRHALVTALGQRGDGDAS